MQKDGGTWEADDGVSQLGSGLLQTPLWDVRPSHFCARFLVRRMGGIAPTAERHYEDRMSYSNGLRTAPTPKSTA